MSGVADEPVGEGDGEAVVPRDGGGGTTGGGGRTGDAGTKLGSGEALASGVGDGTGGGGTSIVSRVNDLMIFSPAVFVTCRVIVSLPGF